MNAAAFRQLYDYHFSENRKLWGYIIQLTPEQFSQEASYSRGSVRDQVIHLMDCDDTWFSELAGVEPFEPIPADPLDNREIIRARWDSLEQKLRGYLAELRDDMLFSTPIVEPEEDKDLIVWQVLLHVVNHGTDHRAQILRQLNDLGVQTSYQDYIFHIFEHASRVIDDNHDKELM
jgi:uncharacterized damage-inducible protein DinB